MSDYVGRRCGKCGAPIVSLFAVCKCGFGPQDYRIRPDYSVQPPPEQPLRRIITIEFSAAEHVAEARVFRVIEALLHAMGQVGTLSMRSEPDTPIVGATSENQERRMSEPPERDRKSVQWLADRAGLPSGISRDAWVNAGAEIIAAARAEGRLAAIGECAQLIETLPYDRDLTGIAAQIRALDQAGPASRKA